MSGTVVPPGPTKPWTWVPTISMHGGGQPPPRCALSPVARRIMRIEKGGVPRKRPGEWLLLRGVTEFATGTEGQELNLFAARTPNVKLNSSNPLHQALKQLGALVQSKEGAAPNGAARSLPM